MGCSCCNINVTEIEDAALHYHNIYRKKHNIKSLKLSSKLNEKAHKILESLQNKKNLDYIFDDDNEGENLYISNKVFDIKKVCDSWYDENKNYDFDSDEYQEGTGHFTQMIWKDTEEVGFAHLKSKDDKHYFLALYSPPGNELFKFKENVTKI